MNDALTNFLLQYCWLAPAAERLDDLGLTVESTPVSYTLLREGRPVYEFDHGGNWARAQDDLCRWLLLAQRLCRTAALAEGV